jgi:hypothetical protein
LIEPNTIANEVAAPPSSAWLRFVLTYGPTPNNLTMFDEYVTGAGGRAKVQPIALSTPMLDPMKAYAASGKPGSVLIAGTPGDGKTDHGRVLWTSSDGEARAWAAKRNIKEHRLAEGRLAGYVLRRWGIGSSDDHRLDPVSHHLWLRNPQTHYRVESASLAPRREAVWEGRQ